MFKCNEYFDGKVKSLAFQTPDKAATVGVMAAGDYTFATAEAEIMTVVSGELIVTLPGSDSAKSFVTGDSFNVPANSSFDVRVPVDTAYLCLYG